MSEKTIPLAVIMVMLVSLSIPMATAQPPMPPCWFYGTVSVEGLPAQDNLNVTAVIRGTNLTWTTKTKNGTYGWVQMGSTSFYIPYDNLTSPIKDGGINGETIEFYLSGTKTNQTATFESLDMKRVDLSVGSAPDGGDGGDSVAPIWGEPWFWILTVALILVVIIGAAYALTRKKPPSQEHKSPQPPKC